jgi:hypothetical protein
MREAIPVLPTKSVNSTVTVSTGPIVAHFHYGLDFLQAGYQSKSASSHGIATLTIT